MKEGQIPIPADAPNWLSNLVGNLQSWVMYLRTGPQPLTAYAKAKLPNASTSLYKQIYVTDDVGGAVPAFSDGANWRRVTDRNIIS